MKATLVGTLNVMSNKYLGQTFDIHGGGLENKFPHHECEIAQSEALYGVPFCRYWVHNNMVTVDGVKMGKSLGNFKTCEDLLAKHTPEAIRAFILSTHYRSPSNYTEEAISATQSGINRLSQIQQALLELIAKKVGASTSDTEAIKLAEEVNSKIKDCLDDDLDTPGAIANIYSFVTNVNRFIGSSSISSEAAKKIYDVIKLWAGDILGILPEAKKDDSGLDIAPIMDMIIELRKEMKAQKKYDVADAIRDKLKVAGIILEDTKDGVRWKKA